MRKLLLHAPLAIDAPKWTDPHTKVNALLQSHFSRASIPSGDLAADQRTVLAQTTRLLQVRPAVLIRLLCLTHVAVAVSSICAACSIDLPLLQQCQLLPVVAYHIREP